MPPSVKAADPVMNKDGKTPLALSFHSGRGRQMINDRDSPSLVRKAWKKWMGWGGVRHVVGELLKRMERKPPKRQCS